ncbi:MAG: iron chelate uptake ABC transporter family permease subunit [Leucobacter sp.]
MSGNASVALGAGAERSFGPFASRGHRSRYLVMVVSLVAAAVAVTLLLMSWGNQYEWLSERWWRISKMRVTSIVVIATVTFAQAMATVTFQTVTNNRIITPSIMGFESLYRVVQTGAVFALGTAGVTALQGVWQFVGQVVLMVAFAALLYGWLLSGRNANLHVMLLVGIVLGGGLSALATFLQRMLTPTEFDVLTARLIGSLANADPSYLAVSIPLAATAGGLLWLGAGRLNVLALGRETAINLGVPHRRQTIVVLLLVSVLMAVSTSLIGPMTFFGFLVAMSAYQLADTHDHRYLFPVAWLAGIVVLGGAYFVLRNVFYAQGAVGIIIEIVGGTLFLAHLLRKGRL